MSTKLNQIIAIEKGIKSRAYAAASELHKINQKPALFEGFQRAYTPKDDDGERLPAESKVVQFRARDILAKLRLDIGNLMDITVQKDIANTQARANVVVDDAAILTDIPVTALLFLEKQLTDLRAFAEHLPTLDIGEDWTLDPNAGLYRTAPVATQRTKKVKQPVVLYHATEKHPAQTEMVTEDVTAGYWSTVKLSAALPAPEKEKIVERIDKLLIAVKSAREEANAIDAGQRPQIGALVFDYLLG